MYVELFGRPKFEILADLITVQNNVTPALNASYLTFGDVKGATVPGTEERVSVPVTGRSPYSGQRVFTYTRIDLNKLLGAQGPSLILPETANTVTDLLPLIQTKYKIYIDEVDVANATELLPFIPEGETAVVTVQTKAGTDYNSHVWSGNLDITIAGGMKMPRGAILTESGKAITTENDKFIVTEQGGN
ncbi:hypothetical protein HAYMO_94 [Serratia phage vB_SmaM_Haymo]|nr:hypothetical protein HAYMO_94 [Serratia phage vB_SmaM_Haymo]